MDAQKRTDMLVTAAVVAWLVLSLLFICRPYPKTPEQEQKEIREVISILRQSGLIAPPLTRDQQEHIFYYFGADSAPKEGAEHFDR